MYRWNCLCLAFSLFVRVVTFSDWTTFRLLSLPSCTRHLLHCLSSVLDTDRHSDERNSLTEKVLVVVYKERSKIPQQGYLPWNSWIALCKSKACHVPLFIRNGNVTFLPLMKKSRWSLVIKTILWTKSFPLVIVV